MKKHILPILLATLSLGLAACGSSTDSSSSDVSSSSEVSSQTSSQSSSATTKTLENITVNDNHQTEYILGEGFNYDDLVVTAHYSDSSTKTVSELDYEISGFDSTTLGEKTVTVTYETKTTSFKVTINPEPTYTVTFTVNVSGIDSYSDFHQKIYMNGDILGSATSWGTRVLTQDSTDSNKWTITVSNVHAGAYEYNFYYGNASDPDWTNGKNILEDSDHLACNVSESALAFAHNVTFNVPSFVTKDITLKITPQIVTSYGADPVALTDGNYLWAWNNSTNDTVLFTKQSDGSWTYDMTVNIDTATGEGSLKYTATLSSNNVLPLWDYQQGDYSGAGNAWENWSDLTIAITLDSETVQTATATFNSQPTPLTNPYVSTFVLSFTDTESDVKGVALQTSENSGALTWRVNFTYDETNKVWTATYVTDVQDLWFCFKTWGNNYEWDSSLSREKATWWSCYHLTVAEVGVPATIDTQVDEKVNACASYQLVVNTSSCTGCTVTSE